MSKIISIGTAVPKHRTKQSTILEFMHAAYQDDVSSRKLNVLFNNSGIENRYSVIPDFDKSKNQHVFFYGTPSNATIENRIDVFKEQAIPLAIVAIYNAFKKINATIQEFEITHLITVTCTGLSAPGLDVELIEKLNLPKNIFHTSVNFLGCNAAFHALKIADMISRSDEHAKILIVCVELCTLHFQPIPDHDNLLSNTIFGDGAAAVIITSNNHKKKGISMEGFYSLLVPQGKNLMGWNITPINFEMILDAKIPTVIGDVVNELLASASQKFNVTPESITHWAIHPGGKKIVDVIKSKLNLNHQNTKASYKILNDYGNMSSSTILFVLNEIMEEKHCVGETIFSIGFGPGLSIETALFKYE